MNYSLSSLITFVKAVLQSFGCDENEASIVADHLVEANLKGHDSHGVGMLPMYGLQVRDGNLIPNQTPEFGEPSGAVTVVDAKRGFGHRMTLLALDHAMQTIPTHKVAILGLRNSGHISRVGTYSEYCATKGYVSIHMVNVVGHDPLVAPFGSRQTGFSTNPVSMAMPVNNEASPLLDMATSTIAFGKVRVANAKGEKVPPGTLVDHQGLPTTDPKPMAEQQIGALTAFGDHKGSGLGIFAELMAGALVGTNTVEKAELFPNGVLNNMLSIIIDPAGFDDPQNIANRVTGYSDFIKGLIPAVGTDKVLLPGEPETMSKNWREQHGIPVDNETLRQIIDITGSFGVNEVTLRALLETISTNSA